MNSSASSSIPNGKIYPNTINNSNSSNTSYYPPNPNNNNIVLPNSSSQFSNGIPSQSILAPPLPPRPQMSYVPSMPSYHRPSPYSSYYPSYGFNQHLPSYYGTSGGYGNNYYMGQGHSFAELAEQKSAPAFQSIESFVGAFTSVSYMLDSTFHALYSSFRAVVEVVDHLGRFKDVIKALTIFRFFRWIFKRLMYLIGVSKIKPEKIESIWKSLNGTDEAKSKPSSWPILFFLASILTGPYLIYKLITSLTSQIEEDPKWATGEMEHFVALAEYDFEPSSEKELKLRRGALVKLAPSEFQPAGVRGWVLASDGVKTGLVPSNYIKILEKRGGNSLVNTTIINNYPLESRNSTCANLNESPPLSRSSSQSTLKGESLTPSPG